MKTWWLVRRAGEETRIFTVKPSAAFLERLHVDARVIEVTPVDSLRRVEHDLKVYKEAIEYIHTCHMAEHTKSMINVILARCNDKSSIKSEEL